MCVNEFELQQGNILNPFYEDEETISMNQEELGDCNLTQYNLEE